MKKLIRYFTLRKRIIEAIVSQQNQIATIARAQLESKRDNDCFAFDFWTNQRSKSEDISKILNELL